MPRIIHWITVAAMFAFATGVRNPAYPAHPPVLVVTRVMSRRRSGRPARKDGGTLRHFAAAPVHAVALVNWPF